MNNDRKKNFDTARLEMLQQTKKSVLTEDLTKSIHNLLEPSLQGKYRNQFDIRKISLPTRKCAYQPPLGMYVVLDMPKMLDEINNNQSSIYEVAARLYWGIMKIHPFSDGNTRLARILTSFILLQNGYSDSFCLAFEKHLENDLLNYNDALYPTDQIVYKGYSKVSLQWLEYFKKSMDLVAQSLQQNVSIK